MAAALRLLLPVKGQLPWFPVLVHFFPFTIELFSFYEFVSFLLLLLLTPSLIHGGELGFRLLFQSSCISLDLLCV